MASTEATAYGSSSFCVLERNSKYRFFPRSLCLAVIQGREVLVAALSRYGYGENGGVAVIDIPSGRLIKVIDLNAHIGFVLPTDLPGSVIIAYNLSIYSLNLETGALELLRWVSAATEEVTLSDAIVFNSPTLDGSGLFVSTQALSGPDLKKDNFYFVHPNGTSKLVNAGVNSCSLNLTTKDAEEAAFVVSLNPAEQILRRHSVVYADGEDAVIVDSNGMTVRDFSMLKGLQVECGCLLNNGRIALGLSRKQGADDTAKVIILDSSAEVEAEILVTDCPRVTSICPIRGYHGFHLAIATASAGTNRSKHENAGTVFVSDEMPIPWGQMPPPSLYRLLL